MHVCFHCAVYVAAGWKLQVYIVTRRGKDSFYVCFTVCLHFRSDCLFTLSVCLPSLWTCLFTFSRLSRIRKDIPAAFCDSSWESFSQRKVQMGILPPEIFSSRISFLYFFLFFSFFVYVFRSRSSASKMAPNGEKNVRTN